MLVWSGTLTSVPLVTGLDLDHKQLLQLLTTAVDGATVIFPKTPSEELQIQLSLKVPVLGEKTAVIRLTKENLSESAQFSLALDHLHSKLPTIVANVDPHTFQGMTGQFYECVSAQIPSGMHLVSYSAMVHTNTAWLGNRITWNGKSLQTVGHEFEYKPVHAAQYSTISGMLVLAGPGKVSLDVKLCTTYTVSSVRQAIMTVSKMES